VQLQWLKWTCAAWGVRLSLEGPRRRRGGEEWGGVPLPIRLGGLRERRKLPQRGPPQMKTNLMHFICHRSHLVEDNLNPFKINLVDGQCMYRYHAETLHSNSQLHNDGGFRFLGSGSISWK